MHLPILCFVAAQTAAAQGGPQTSYRAEFAASGALERVNQGAYSGTEASGGANATWFVGRPLTDDELPLALQAYLQQLNRLSLSFGGGGLWAGSDTNSYRHSNSSLNGSLGGHFYRGAMVLGGGLFYERVADHQSGGSLTGDDDLTTQLWSAGISGGLRSDTLEVLGTYRWRSYDDNGQARPATWGQAGLRLESVLDNEIKFHVDGYTLTDGGGASAGTEFFSSPELGGWISGFMEAGQVYVNSTTDYHRMGASFGVGWWATRRFELQFSLGFASAKRSSGPSTSLTTSLATLGIVLRAPKRYQSN